MSTTTTRRAVAVGIVCLAATAGATVAPALCAAETNMGAERGFSYAIGQAVTHRNQSLPSIVLERVRASNGIEFYGIEVADGRRLWILGEVLMAA